MSRKNKPIMFYDSKDPSGNILAISLAGALMSQIHISMCRKH